MPPAYVEFVLAMWVLSARDLADAKVTPIATLLPHAAPAELALHREVFGPHLRFDTGLAELHVHTEVMLAPLPRADVALGQALDQHVEGLLRQLTTRGALARAVSLAIERRLPDGPPRLELVASDLALTPRALRGRLEQEATTFLRVVEETRQRLAETMVTDSSLSLAEIAFRLGFSEPSAFHRAYRRWTGRTPRS
jgi:AraC-like DNA-binding protein